MDEPPHVDIVKDGKSLTVELMLDGVHWPEIDEDMPVSGLPAGRKAPGAVEPSLAAE